MNLTDTIRLKFQAGKPVIFKDICTVRSPFMGEVAQVGYDRFFEFISILLVKKPENIEGNEMLKELIAQLSDFEYLLMITQVEETGEKLKLLQDALEFFTGERTVVMVNPPQIVFGDINEKRIMTKDDFEDFQSLISFACANPNQDEDLAIDEDDDPGVRELKKKLAKGRKIREAIKQKNRKKDGSNVSISDLVGSLTFGSNGAYNLLNVWDLTYYAFQDQLRRMNWHEEFNINTRAAMAGAKIEKSKLSHWIKNMTFK